MAKELNLQERVRIVAATNAVLANPCIAIHTEDIPLVFLLISVNLVGGEEFLRQQRDNPIGSLLLKT